MYIFCAAALMRTLLLILSPAFAKPFSGRPPRSKASYLYTYVLPGAKSGTVEILALSERHCTYTGYYIRHQMHVKMIKSIFYFDILQG